VPFQISLILVLAHGSYRYIEVPLRYADWSTLRYKAIGYGFGAQVLAAGILLVLVKSMHGRLYTGTPPDLIAHGVETLTDTYYMPDRLSSWNGDRCVLSSNDQVGKIISIEECTLGNFSTAKHRVLVLGDSFSAAFVQAFDTLVLSDKYSVTITSAWGASPVAEIPNKNIWNKANDYYWKFVVPSLVSRLRTDDWVFLVNDLTGFYSEHELKQLEKGLVNLSNHLSKVGIRLAILHGNPFAREANCDPALAARQWFAPFGGPCFYLSKEDTLSRRTKLHRMLSDLSNQNKIAIVDLIDVFCPDLTCTYFAKNGQILYRDVYSHPSVEAARLSEPIIRYILTTTKPASGG
jgi:hypothetical protein